MARPNWNSGQVSDWGVQKELPGTTTVVAGGITYVRPPGSSFNGGLGTQSLAADFTYYNVIEVGKQITLTQLNVLVNTTGTATDVSISVHACDQTLTPTGLVLDAGTVSVGTTGLKSITGLSAVLHPGLYLLRNQANGSWTPAAPLGPTWSRFGSTSNAFPRLFVNNSSSYSATAPDPGPSINAIVAGTNSQYHVVTGVYTS